METTTELDRLVRACERARRSDAELAAMNRFELVDAMSKERALAAMIYGRLKEQGRHAEAQEYYLRATTLSKVIAKIVRTLKASEPGGSLYKQRQARKEQGP